MTVTESAARATAVTIDVSSVVARLAFKYVVESAGWSHCTHLAECSCLRVGESVSPRESRVDVLVVRDRPADCQAGLDFLLGGHVKALVLWNEPESLDPVLAGFGQGLCAVPDRVIELALSAPRLTRRMRDTLSLVACGRSSRVIAEALHESESTAKRDISELLRVFDAPNRTAMVSTAARLGFIPGLETALPV